MEYFKTFESFMHDSKEQKLMNNIYHTHLDDSKIEEKEGWLKYLSLLGYDAKKFKKLDSNAYEYYKKAYMKSPEASEFEQNYLEDLERDITKTKL